MKKNDIFKKGGAVYQLLQTPYFDETIDGQECLKAKANEITDDRDCMLIWPIKNDSYSHNKFYEIPAEY